MVKYRLYIEFEIPERREFNKFFKRVSKAVTRYFRETFAGEIIRIELDINEF